MKIYKLIAITHKICSTTYCNKCIGGHHNELQCITPSVKILRCDMSVNSYSYSKSLIEGYLW